VHVRVIVRLRVLACVSAVDRAHVCVHVSTTENRSPRP